MNRAAPPVFPTVVHMLAEVAARYPAREALVLGGERLLYADYLSCIGGFARELQARGAAGQRIAIILPNSIEICVATWAAHASGAQVVPINPLYTERELEAILEDAAPAVLIFDSARAQVIESLARKLAIPHFMAITTGVGALTRWRGQALSLPRPLPSAGAAAFVQYTGGTTGRSKGVILTHAAVSTNVSQREAMLPTLGEDARNAEGSERILCAMPLFHSYALAMGLYLSAYCGATLVIMPRYRPEELLRLLVAERITIFPGSPTIFTGLMGHADFANTDFSRIHTCYSGSAPLPEETLNRWEAAVGAPIYEGYGQTESGPVLTYNPVTGVRKPGSVGIALADTEVQVVDAEKGTRILGVGEKGEIRARGPQIMSGYRNMPKETAEALRDGWLYTGDVGEFDADGYLYIRDRKKDMVIVGGYNVYPREVDDVLFMHPDVQDAAALGVPDSYKGEVVRAYVVLRPGASATPEMLQAHCAARLARYKVPVSITILDVMPKTTVNKTDKKTLREWARTASVDTGARPAA